MRARPHARIAADATVVAVWAAGLGFCVVTWVWLLSLIFADPADAQGRPRGQAVVNQTATYTAPDASAIAAANVAVTVFAANTVNSGCDIVNTGTAVLYVDMTATAVAGSGTAIPIQPGQTWHCPYPPATAVSAVASAAQGFVAIRY